MFVSTQISLELWIRLAYGSPLNDTHIYCSYIHILAYDSVLNDTQFYYSYIHILAYDSVLNDTPICCTDINTQS